MGQCRSRRGSYQGTPHELRPGSTPSTNHKPVRSDYPFGSQPLLLTPLLNREPLTYTSQTIRTKQHKLENGKNKQSNKQIRPGNRPRIVGVSSEPSESRRSLLGRSVNSLPTHLLSINHPPHPPVICRTRPGPTLAGKHQRHVPLMLAVHPTPCNATTLAQHHTGSPAGSTFT